jgi:hypothetical protein
MPVNTDYFYIVRGALPGSSSITITGVTQEDLDAAIDDVTDNYQSADTTAGTTANAYSDSQDAAQTDDLTTAYTGADADVTADLQAAIDAPIDVDSITDNYTLHLADGNSIVECNTSDDIMVTAPSAATITGGIMFDSNTLIAIYNRGSGAVEVAPDAGVTFEPTGSVSVQRYTSCLLRFQGSNIYAVEQQGVNTVNAQDFGAHGDWDRDTDTGTDDTAALAALFAAGAGDLVDLGVGTYGITETILVEQDTYVLGRGGGQYSGSYITDAATTNIVKINGNSGTGAYTIDATYPSGVNEACFLARANSSFHNIAFIGTDNVTFLTAGTFPSLPNNCDYGIYGYDEGVRNNLVIEDCQFRYFKRAGIGGYLHQMWARYCTAAANMRGIDHGLELDGSLMANPGSDNTITGGTYRHHVTDGIVMRQAYLRLEDARVEWNAHFGVWTQSQCLIVGNLFDRNGWNGINCGQHPNISANYMDRNGCGGDGNYGRDGTVTRGSFSYDAPPDEASKAHIQVRQAGGTGALGIANGNTFDSRRGTSNLGAKSPKYIVAMQGSTANGTRFTGNGDDTGFLDATSPTITLAATAVTSTFTVTVSQGNFFFDGGGVTANRGTITFHGGTTETRRVAGVAGDLVIVDSALTYQHANASQVSTDGIGNYWDTANGGGPYLGGDIGNAADVTGTSSTTVPNTQPRIPSSSAYGTVLRTKAGAPADGDYPGATIPDGILAINTSNNKLYWRSSGAWTSVAGA